MKQLMAKSILYEPLKELRDKYVPWLEQNQPKLETSEYLRYTKQYRLLQEIIQVYDTEGDDGFQKIVDLMQLVCYLFCVVIHQNEVSHTNCYRCKNKASHQLTL